MDQNVIPGLAQRNGIEGGQSIARAADLLAHVAHRGEQGARLAHIVAQSGLNIATTRRLLQALVAGGLLSFDSSSKIYTVGPAIFTYATQASPLFAQRDIFAQIVASIAQRTGDTAMLSIRSGFEVISLIRREGVFPIRVMSLDEGSRRPLGVDSGGLAILAFLPSRTRDLVLDHCASLYGSLGLTVAQVADGMAQAQATGFGYNPGHLIDGVYGVAVPVLRDGAAVAALSVAAIASRMTAQRRHEVVAIIRDELSALHGYAVPDGQSARMAQAMGNGENVAHAMQSADGTD